jgi:hypothetical protein
MKSVRQVAGVFAVVLGGAIFASPVSALQDEDFNYGTTTNLYRICSAGPDVEGSVAAGLACRAFLSATVQYHDAVTSREGLKPLICYPKTATIGDAQEIFVAWAQANGGNAELMAERPVKGVVRALAAKHPCK